MNTETKNKQIDTSDVLTTHKLSKFMDMMGFEWSNEAQIYYQKYKYNIHFTRTQAEEIYNWNTIIDSVKEKKNKSDSNETAKPPGRIWCAMATNCDREPDLLEWTGKNEVHMYNFLENKNIEYNAPTEGKKFYIDMCNGTCRTGNLILKHHDGNGRLVNIGDVIIKSVTGDFYICKDVPFRWTHDDVTSDEEASFDE